MPVTITRTAAYLDRKAQLGGQRRQSLELAEEGIMADPHGRLGRRDGPNNTTIDSTEFGLLVSFRFVDDRTVELLDFVDLTD